MADGGGVPRGPASGSLRHGASLFTRICPKSPRTRKSKSAFRKAVFLATSDAKKWSIAELTRGPMS